MTQLSPLRNQLGSLRRKRQAVRWGAAWTALVIGVLWILAVLFLLDWQLAMTRAERVMAMVIGLGVVVWAYRRDSRPLLGTHETDLDMALMVERQQQIDSDLVAALQFESPEARRWGSTQLEGAVIDYVAEFSRGWNLLEGFSARQFVKRGTILAVTLALLVAAVLWQPRYAKIFFARLGMGSQHYPTRTMIEEVRVNGAAVPQGSDKPVRHGLWRAGRLRRPNLRRGSGRRPQDRLALRRQRHRAADRTGRRSANRLRRAARSCFVASYRSWSIHSIIRFT